MIIIIISIIILIVFAANLSILITKPIMDLVKEANSIAEGRIGTKIQVRTTDEVGRLAESFNILIENIKRANQLASLGMLSAGVAHEIRNPLTSIRGFAQYIKSELGGKHELVEDVAIIINEVDRLNNIVDRFLNFARPEDPAFEFADVNNSIKNAISLIKEGQLPHNINLQVSLDKLPHIYVDSNQIEQAILNLILNAIQAMPEGGTIRISSNIDYEMNTVKISICDNGAGIPPDIENKVFQPFFTTKGKGTGLGLAICARIIEGHKGMIELHSISNVETCFTIVLPANSEEKGGE
jgi:signal transduction histidine kinase